MSLQKIATIRDAQSRRSSSWDRTGGNIDCFTDIAPGQCATLLETTGAGKVTHIWLTVKSFAGFDTVLRDLVLRAYWDGSDMPSVEVPLGDFFGLGHALPPHYYERREYQVVSEPLTVGLNERSMNCYWPMPFREGARIEIFNNGTRSLRQLYFHVDDELGAQSEPCGLFHAEFRQETQLKAQPYINLDGRDNYVLFETRGRGQYVGCFLYVDGEVPHSWWEGDDMIFIDGSAMPAINGTGTEDYFNNAWGYRKAFCYPYYGCPLYEKRADGGAFTTMYRFHVPDPIRFREQIRVTFEHCWEPKYTHGYASVAFWYQEHPVRTRQPLPAASSNHPRRHAPEPADRLPAGDPLLIDLPSLEEPLRGAGVAVRTISVLGQEWLVGDRNGGALLIGSNGTEIAIPLGPFKPGRYRVEVKPIYRLIEGELELSVRPLSADGASPDTATVWQRVLRQQFPRENEAPARNLGEVRLDSGRLELLVRAPGVVPLHAVRLIELS